MASFVSYKSDISALRAKLASLSRKLEESTREASTFEDPKDAYSFIETQEKRVQKVERDFLKATDDILPIDHDGQQVSKQMTVTEMAELIRSLQDSQVRQVEGLLEQLGVNQDATTTTVLDVPATHCSIGGPLNPVIETDNETDGTLTTPGSSTFISPAFQSAQTESSTPQTPDLYNLNLSASTTSILREQSTRKPPTPRQSALNEAYLALQMKLQNEIHQSQLRDDNDHDADVESSGASESSEEHVEYDDDGSFDEGHTMASTVVAQDRYKMNRRETEHDYTDSDDEIVEKEDEDDIDTLDDSALYCPTVLARDRRPNNNARVQPAASSPSDKPNFTHIEVDTELPSPAPTNLTIDTTAFFNETMDRLDPLPESNDDASVASEETAVLDRYRLDADENSPHGFRVVPNPRGSREAKRKKNSEAKFSPVHSVIPKSTPRNRPKRVFRKTPYPKFPSTPTIDENAPLNIDTSPLFSPTSFPSLASQSPMTAIPSQSVRRSLCFSATKKKKDRTASLSPSLLYAKAHLQLTTPKPVSDYTSISIPPLKSKNNRDTISRTQIKAVTKQEYDEAPRVVQMQVSLDEVQSATAALNETLGLCKGPLQFQEKEANRIFRPLGFDERKSKSVLMSLCHWRRLLMRRPSSGDQLQSQGIVFDVICN